METIEDPQNSGAAGAALTAGLGLGAISNFAAIKAMIPITGNFSPSPQHKYLYDNYFKVFKKLYKSNKQHFQSLNKPEQS